MGTFRINRRRLSFGLAACFGVSVAGIVSHARLRNNVDCPCGYRITDLDEEWECGLRNADPIFATDHPELISRGKCLYRKG
jgi:hypothetical protein